VPCAADSGKPEGGSGRPLLPHFRHLHSRHGPPCRLPVDGQVNGRLKNRLYTEVVTHKCHSLDAARRHGRQGAGKTAFIWDN
jgi:hypothetical protein